MKAKIVGIVLSFAVIVLTTIWVIAAINTSRIDSWLVRAKDAGNPAQVAEFLTNYKRALYDNGYVNGKYTSLFRYPADYMPTYIRTVDGLIVRAQELATQAATEVSYQMGLVNLEKDLGDIHTSAYSVWFASGGIVIAASCLVGWCSWLVIIFILGDSLS